MNKAVLVLVFISGVLLGSTQVHAQLFYQPQTSNVAFAFCFNQSGQIVPNCNVTLSNGYFFTPAQHNHESPPPPVSTLSPTSGNTGTTGLPVTVATTQVGQIEGIVVCSDLCTLTDVYVGYFDFVDLGTSADYVLIGATGSHPTNHFGADNAVSGIRAVASQYRAEFPANPVIAVNDIGLPIGGQFDLNRNWVAPHASHGRGKAVDIRGNGNPNSVPRIAAVQTRFIEICRENGAMTVLHESRGTTNEHFHCQWP